MDPSAIGKLLVVLGIVLAIFGGILWGAGRMPFLGHLPGDIEVRGEHYTIYFPIMTCIVVSIVLSLVLWIVMRSR